MGQMCVLYWNTGMLYEIELCYINSDVSDKVKYQLQEVSLKQ